MSRLLLPVLVVVYIEVSRTSREQRYGETGYGWTTESGALGRSVDRAKNDGSVGGDYCRLLGVNVIGDQA